MAFINLYRVLIVICFAALTGCANLHDSAQSSSGGEMTSRTVDLTNPPVDVWERIRRGYAIPNLNSPLVDKWTQYYASHPEAMQRMADRAGVYLYYIVDEINRRNMPTELALLPFVESAYNPSAYSRARAAGLWQFIPSTGTHFKLKQDWWRDERRDPVASTNAALDYLEYLYELQGSWYLALASYNWGEGAVARAMNKNLKAGKPTNYMSLKMPAETENYVPKLQAIKNIVADPERYAVILPIVSNEPYFVAVKKNANIDTIVAARLAEIPLAEFEALNPSFNQGVILANMQLEIILPRDKVEIYNANFLAFEGELTSWKTYPAKEGQTISSIAKEFDVSEASLRRANGLSNKIRRLPYDQAMIIPAPGTIVSKAPITAPKSAQKQASKRQKGSGKTVSHRVRKGDTLSQIARQYNTTVPTLLAANNLRSANIKAGQTLRIPK
jgi:membrane-bound lytic murein transglycosylase D